MATGPDANRIEAIAWPAGGGTAAAVGVGASGPNPELFALTRQVATGPPSTVAAPPATPTTTTTPAVTAVTVRPATVPVPPVGEATASGCAAALAYLAAYEAPGFSAACPAYSDGYQATTSCAGTDCTAGQRVITITVPCAEAYMNEASNSWVLAGMSRSAIDPYGYCQ
jgi:hypothetical protein